MPDLLDWKTSPGTLEALNRTLYHGYRVFWGHVLFYLHHTGETKTLKAHVSLCYPFPPQLPPSLRDKVGFCLIGPYSGVVAQNPSKEDLQITIPPPPSTKDAWHATFRAPLQGRRFLRLLPPKLKYMNWVTLHQNNSETAN